MSTDDPEDLHDLFLKNVAAYEEREPGCLFDLLPESGIPLPPPEELGDEDIGRKLWDVIHGLAQFGTFLHNTNHLSDRELYIYLWSDALREEAVLMPEDPSYAYHIDLVGSGSEEDIHLYLKYYASNKERREWLKDWPTDPLPDRETPLYDRDRRLPTAEARGETPVV
jgi:hypothetical protein